MRLPVRSFHLYLCEKCVLDVSELATSIAFMSACGNGAEKGTECESSRFNLAAMRCASVTAGIAITRNRGSFQRLRPELLLIPMYLRNPG
jgi:hypothetical protein